MEKKDKTSQLDIYVNKIVEFLSQNQEEDYFTLGEIIDVLKIEKIYEPFVRDKLKVQKDIIHEKDSDNNNILKYKYIQGGNTQKEETKIQLQEKISEYVNTHGKMDLTSLRSRFTYATTTEFNDAIKVLNTSEKIWKAKEQNDFTIAPYITSDEKTTMEYINKILTENQQMKMTKIKDNVNALLKTEAKLPEIDTKITKKLLSYMENNKEIMKVKVGNDDVFLLTKNYEKFIEEQKEFEDKMSKLLDIIRGSGKYESEGLKKLDPKYKDLIKRINLKHGYDVIVQGKDDNKGYMIYTEEKRKLQISEFSSLFTKLTKEKVTDLAEKLYSKKLMKRFITLTSDIYDLNKKEVIKEEVEEMDEEDQFENEVPVKQVKKKQPRKN